METSTIIYIILGSLALLFLFKRKWISENSQFDSYEDKKNEWSILISFSGLRILSKYAGELRFGPMFIHIKTEVNNIFGKEFYGDWFYKTKDGIYLQKWNSNPIKSGVKTKADNDLVFYDPVKNKIQLIKAGIASYHWTMESDENNDLTLISDNGRTKNRMKITNANNSYT